MSIKSVVVVIDSADSAIASPLFVALDAWGIAYTLLEIEMFSVRDDMLTAFADCLIWVWTGTLTASHETEQHFAAWVESRFTADGSFARRIIQMRFAELSITAAPMQVERIFALPTIDATQHLNGWLTHLAHALGVQVMVPETPSLTPDLDVARLVKTTSQVQALIHDARFRWRQRVGTRRAPQLVLADDHLIATSDVGVAVLDRHTGAVLWQRRDLPSRESALPVPSATVGSDHIFIATAQAVHALRRADGETVWSVPLDTSISPGMVAAGDTLFAATEDDGLYAWSSTDGTLRWHVRLPGMPTLPAPLVADAARVYCGARDSHVYAFATHDGTLLWQRLVGGSVFDQPTLDEGRLYVTGFNADMFALDATSGAVIWHVDAGQGSASPLLWEGVLYQGSFVNGAVTAVRAADGVVLWQSDGHGAVNDKMAGDSAANAVFVFGYGGWFCAALSRLDGSRLWSMRRPDFVNSSSSLLCEGMIYYTADDGYIYALALGPDQDTRKEG